MSNDSAPRRRSVVVVVSAAVVVVVAFLVAGKIRSDSDTAPRACAWNANISNADRYQAGLIRCYLRAVAQHSDSGLRSVTRSTDNGGPTGFTDADFAHAADASSGPATVTVTANDSDSAEATVTIRYANGGHDKQEIALADPNSSHSWRFWNVGSYPANRGTPPSAIPNSTTP